MRSRAPSNPRMQPTAGVPSGRRGGRKGQAVVCPNQLEELLGRRVQVVTERGLDGLLRDRVLQEAIRL